jgi:undecaprenyl diphosphate synthase
MNLGINELTIFAFSTENWNRDVIEVNGLLKLIEIYIKSEIAEMNINNIIFKCIGDKNIFKKSITDLLISAENLTKNNNGMKLNICLNYGGLSDIVSATKSIAKAVEKKELNIQEINEKCLKSHLLSSEVNDVDLLIRTSGERRISNFLPIQISYSEFYFSEILWPDFDKKDLFEAFKAFSKRERRYGSTLTAPKNNQR